MGQVKLLKIAADGVPLEFDSTNDDITLKSFSVVGGGPVMDISGIDMNNKDVSDLKNLLFTDPTTGYINQTAGNLIVDNFMAKERSNAMTTAADILFPVITDVAGEVDAFRMPALAGAPSATPTVSGAGYMVYDSTNKKPYVWTGTEWDDLTTVTTAEQLDESGFTAGEAIAARDVLYISAADALSKALADNSSKSYAIGLATVAQGTVGQPVIPRVAGVLDGFSGLTAGNRYYLSAATAGAITNTIPTGSGNTIVQVGYAKSTTKLQIQILQLGRRA